MDTLRVIFIWLHILGIALYVGPQFFLAFAWIPASRQITDLPTRVAAMKTITRRFGYIGGAGLVLIIVAGGYLISSWRDYYNQPDDLGFTDIWYGVFFIIKMVLFIVMLVVVGVHTFVVGPRLTRLMEAQATGQRVSDENVRKARVQSMALSHTGLLLVLAIMVFGVLMNTFTISFDSV